MCKPLFLNYVLAGYPVLWIETYEEFRAITSFATEIRSIKEKYSLFSWDRIDGIKSFDLKKGVIASAPIDTGNAEIDLGDPIVCLAWSKENLPDNSILFLKDFHPYISKDQVWRKIRNIIPEFKARGRCLVIVSYTVQIPPELEKEVTVVPFVLPDADALKVVLKSICEAAGQTDDERKKLYPKDPEPVIEAAQGMTAFEAENAFAIALSEKKCFDPAVIRREKAAIVKKTGLLEVVDTDISVDDVGGLENLKYWLSARKDCFGEEARKFGITKPPKGALLLGVPGCGKTLTAKSTSRAWDRPLLRLDMGSVFGAYVGESESRIRQVLRIAEAVAPCVLFIDELEKAFAGTKEGDSDGHGTTKRVFGTVLTWMQDRTADVFIIATANDVTSLPAPLLRAQRFDVIFWVDLPGAKEREDILSIHLKKSGQDPTKFDLTKLSKTCETYSGAEIEVWVREAMIHAFHNKHQLTTQDMVDTIKEITPISQVMGADINASRDWAKRHGVKYASKTEPPQVEETSPLRKIASISPN